MGDCGEACFFWDGALGDPPEAFLGELDLDARDVYHAGPILGQAGLPSLLRLVRPAWMLGLDVDPSREHSSWRLSFRAALIRTDLLRHVGGPDPNFESIEGAALDLGLRFLEAGAVMRHYPGLVRAASERSPGRLPWHDELRILGRMAGKKWAYWAAWRAWRRGWWSGRRLVAALRWLGTEGSSVSPRWKKPFSRERSLPSSSEPATVSVLIPTLDRYPFLEVLLGQLQRQTVPPRQVIVVDQTPKERRRNLATTFPSLPLVWIERDEPGQCSSRNEGLRRATGEWILFLDDDVEIPDDFVARHLETVGRFKADASSGTVTESPDGLKERRQEFFILSSVFPAGNSLLRRACLAKAGLFDLAYDYGQRADGDLGMRLYLAGALMILDPVNCILHHHAPRGGLRIHKARTVTRAMSKNSVWKRNLPSSWDFYLCLRYFDADTLAETSLLGIASTLTCAGASLKRMLRFAVGVCSLPSTLLHIRKARRRAVNMLEIFPQISYFD